MAAKRNRKQSSGSSCGVAGGVSTIKHHKRRGINVASVKSAINQH